VIPEETSELIGQRENSYMQSSAKSIAEWCSKRKQCLQSSQ